MYCTACGAELPNGEVAFCPECGEGTGETGDTAESSTETQASKVEGETAPCTKCGTDIATDIERCPECGHEPSSHGIFDTLFAILCIPWAAVGVIFWIAGIGVFLSGGYTVPVFIFAMILFTLFAAPPIIYLYGSYKKTELGPTEELELLSN